MNTPAILNLCLKPRQALAALAAAFLVASFSWAEPGPGAGTADPAKSKPPYLVFLPLSDGIAPAKVFQDRAYIETLPIDGVVMEGRILASGGEKVAYSIWSNTVAITYAQVFDEVAPLKGTFSKLNRSWLMGQTTLKAGDWFDDWSNCLRNFATFAKACKDLGVEGMVLNNCNDNYHPVPIWDYASQQPQSHRTFDEYRQQIRLRGKQIMAACVKEYPAFKLALMKGPALAELGDPRILRSESWDFLSAFYSGLLAGAGDRGMVIDASVFYNVTDRPTFAGSYQFRKYEIPSSRHDSPSVPKEDRALWRQRLKVGHGLSAGYTEEGGKNALLQCDYMCWYYNGANNLDPETLKEAWFPKGRFPSLAAARTAATAPGVNNVASGIHFATTLGAETIRAIPGDATFSYVFDIENNTGSPAKITFQKKPDWVRAGANNATIGGVPPATPQTDTLVAVITADGKSDTLKLTIVTSPNPLRAGYRAHD